LLRSSIIVFSLDFSRNATACQIWPSQSRETLADIPEIMTPPFRLSILAAPLFVVLWATGFIGAKYGLPYIEPVTFLALRFTFVAAALLLWVLLARSAWLTWAQARDAAIIGLQPVLTAFIARQFLGERLAPVQWAGIALGFLGVGLVVMRKLDAGIGDWRGVGFCLGSLVGISIAAILQKTRATDHPVRSSTLVQFIASLVVLVPLSFAFETREVTWSGELIFTMAWLVLVMSLGALSLLLFLIRKGAASNVASLFFLVPPTTAVMAWAIFGEVLGLIEIAGIAATTIGVMMVNKPEWFSLKLTRG
jgi:drug/metabolite transporter (DMT)-like permease